MREQVEEKILLVDDDPNLLAAVRRQYRRQFSIVTAEGGGAGLEILQRDGPFAVVVSDMRMPGMNGAEFLKQVRTLTPDTVRVMLTGYTDLEAAMAAVNEGNIFRFLTKPCPPEMLETTLQACLEQHRLIMAERVLLHQTLNGSIKILTEILAMVNPEAFGRAVRIKRHAQALAARLKVADAWQLELAAMLSQIGCVTIPPGIIGKIYRGQALMGHERRMFNQHPEIGCNLIKNIPRLKEVARIIAYQEKHYDGAGVPKDEVRGDEIPLGARILKVVLDFDTLESANMAPEEALYILQQRDGWYDTAILREFADTLGVRTHVTVPVTLVDSDANWERSPGPVSRVRAVDLRNLKANMIVAQDVRTDNGRLLLSRGQEITEAVLQRLKNVARTTRIEEPLYVHLPPGREASP